MRVTLVACGSRGDVQPMLALALGLEEAGHEVLLTVPPDFETWAKTYGCRVESLGPGFRNNPEMRDASLGSFARFTKQEVKAEIRRLPDLARGSDLILAAGLAFGAHSVAEHLRVPYRMVAFAPLAMMGTDRDPLWMGVASWLARTMTNASLRGLLNRERATLDLPPVRDVMMSWAGERPISATDAALTSLPDGAVPKSIQTAYMHLRQPGTLGPDVEAFLAHGPAPVYVGFGSMPISRPDKLGRLLSQVARRSQQRLVVLTKGYSLDALAGDPRCLVISEAPLEQLLPRVTVAVHHGGSGTVATAARAGIPQIVTPHMADQFQWRTQVARIGLGPRVAPFRALSARRLTSAILECISNPKYAAKAREVATTLKDVDGVALTVKLIGREYGAAVAGATWEAPLCAEGLFSR
jgi:vancomycin aglycone glucosyltransferase